MASSMRRELHSRIYIRFVIGSLLSLLTFALAQAQTATYRLHRENSSTANLFQLKTANPDASSLAVQSANLKNLANGEYVIKEFDTQSGVPGTSGTISAGSTISVEVWMRKTASAGTMFPRVKINLNSSGGASLGVITGTTQLSTTVTKYTLTGTVPANVSMTTSDRFYLWVGVNLTAGTNVNNRGELNVEGTVNGNYDSLIILPLPAAAPSISNLSPTAEAVGTSVTITGTNFGATQGTSTVKFNGTTATPSSWSATSITAPVPSEATTGSVVVTVNSQASNGVPFTVKPKIDNLSPTSGAVGTAVNITGTTFGPTQGSSSVTFNGTAATPTSWSATSISAPVPSGATTGSVVVTVNGQASNGVTFTVNTTGSITGTITRTSDGAPINGALIEALQGGVVEAFSSSAANGSYTISPIDAGTYDVRVSAIGYQTAVETGVVVASGTTTLNKSLAALSSSDITYIYDELGRLVAVVTASEVATYSYDDVGNHLAISRGNASLVSVIEFTPNSGVVGAEVTIYGTAFSTTPSQNTVKFNGVTATVTSSTSTQIVTNVPVGATTGPISVTTPSGTGVSATSFVVGTPLGPTISGFSPNTGSAGTTVVVNGTNFDPVFHNNKLRFSQVYSSITEGTTTSLSTSLSATSASGRITVVTPEGSAESTDDFFFAPSPHVAADIAVTGRMAIGGGVPITISTAGKIAILVFDGVAGQRVNLGLSGVTIGPPCCSDVGTVAIYRPNGLTLLSPAPFSWSGFGSQTLLLPTTGTYAILIDPIGSNTGNVTVALSSELSPPISIDGPTVSLNFNQAGMNARLPFSGTAGQRVTVGLNGVTIGAPCCSDVATTSIYKPDGTVLLSPVAFGQAGVGTVTVVLPVTGTYAILVDPILANTGNATVALSSELSPPISIDGPTVLLNFNRAGMNARLPFDGTAGQRVTVGLNGVTIGAPCCSDVATTSIYKPDGTVLLSPVAYGQAGMGTVTVVLPETGTYVITVDPIIANTGNATVALSSELSPPISIDGPTVLLNFNRAGMNARLPFDGTAGQRVTVGLNGVTIGAPCCSDVATTGIYKPDGTVLLSPVAFGQAGVGTVTVVLPVTGTYAITVDPIFANTGNATVALSSELAPPITIDGPAVSLNFNRAGMNARLPFDGTAGQRVTVGLNGVTIGAPCCSDVATTGIYKPDGTVLLSPVAYGQAGMGSVTVVLPETGTYAITVDPIIANTGNATVALSSELSPPISIDGPTVLLNFNRAGMNARLPFDGTAGQRVSVGVSGVTIGAPCCSEVATTAIYKPDGTLLLAPVGYGQVGVGMVTVVLPVTGTYAITVDPIQANTGNATVALSSELAPPITIDGPTVPLNFNRAGMNARLPFDGTAGQRVSVGVSGVTIGAPCCSEVATTAIYKPDGTVLLGPVGYGQVGVGTVTVVLPETGTYAITVDPIQANTGNATVALSAELSPPISIDGPTVSLNFNRAGMNARLPFDGTAGQRVSVGVSGVTIGAPCCSEVATTAIYKPDGTALLGPIGYGQVGVGTVTVVLPETGTYAITVDPIQANTGNATVALSAELSPPISINGSTVPLNFNRAGMNARLPFDGTAGQRVSVGVSGVTIGAPCCSEVATTAIYKPDGTALFGPVGYGQGGVATPTVILPVTGTYAFTVDPIQANTGNASATLSEDLAAPITLNGPTVPLSISRVAQNAILSFSGTSGSQVTVSITGNTIASVTVTLIKPDGTTLTSTTSGSSSFNLSMQTLPTTGVYTITIDPTGMSTGNITVGGTSP